MILGGQTALVTGGGRGLGRAYAIALAKAGAGVAVTARSQQEVEETRRLIVDAGGKGVAFPADVTDRRGVQARFRSLAANNQFTPIEQSVQLVLELASGKADALSGCFNRVDDNLDDLIAAADPQAEGRQTLRLRN